MYCNARNVYGFLLTAFFSIYSLDAVVSDSESPLCPFLVVITKDPALTTQQRLNLYFQRSSTTKAKGGSDSEGEGELVDVAQASEKVKEKQWMADMRKKIDTLGNGVVFELKLHDQQQQQQQQVQQKEDNPKYILTIVDQRKRTQNVNGKCAVFIVPQGREHEWMFATEEGKLQLADTAGYSRLIIVTLGRNHTFTDLASIQSELSPKILELVPKTMNGKSWLI